MSNLFTLHYLPCIAWFQHYVRLPDCTLEKFDHYNKQTYRNRCKILGANGELDLIIPVKKNGAKQLYASIAIENDFDWRSQHWQSIQSAYGKSAYFEFYTDYFIRIYKDNTIESLYEFNLTVLKLILKCLKLEQPLQFSSAYISETTEMIDFRFNFNPKNKSRENELITPIQYWQVFEEKFGRIQNLSILDLLFNLGPDSLSLLKK